MDEPSDLNISDLTPPQRSLFEEGRKVMLPIEHARLERVLASHLRQGTSKYARSIPNEGISSVTLSLSGALWVVRAMPALFVGLAIVVTTSGASPVNLIGYVIVGIGAVLFLLGASRLAAAVRSRKRFRRNSTT